MERQITPATLERLVHTQAPAAPPNITVNVSTAGTSDAAKPGLFRQIVSGLVTVAGLAALGFLLYGAFYTDKSASENLAALEQHTTASVKAAVLPKWWPEWLGGQPDASQ